MAKPRSKQPAPPAPPTHALSLFQPWLWLVLHAGKDVENRSWFSRRTGPIWLHASLTRDPAEYDRALIFARSAGYSGAVPPLDELPVGVIAGRTTILRCMPPIVGQLPWMGFRVLPWHMRDQYGYVLDKTQAVAAPVACRGFPNFWPVPVGVLAQLTSV